MSMYNLVKLTGYVSTDKDNSPLATKTIGEGDKAYSILNFAISVPRDRKDKDNKKVYDRIRVSASGSRADFIAKYFNPGDVIEVEGALTTGSYEKNGEKVYTWEVRIESAGFPLGNGNKGERSGADKTPASTYSSGKADTGDFTEITEEDDLPF